MPLGLGLFYVSCGFGLSQMRKSKLNLGAMWPRYKHNLGAMWHKSFFSLRFT